MIRKSGYQFSEKIMPQLKAHWSYDDGQARKDDQGRADRQRDPPPPLATGDADRTKAQQDRPGHRAAGHACGPRHDRKGSTSRPRRRREISWEHDPEKWQSLFGWDH